MGITSIMYLRNTSVKNVTSILSFKQFLFTYVYTRSNQKVSRLKRKYTYLLDKFIYIPSPSKYGSSESIHVLQHSCHF